LVGYHATSGLFKEEIKKHGFELKKGSVYFSPEFALENHMARAEYYVRTTNQKILTWALEELKSSNFKESNDAKIYDELKRSMAKYKFPYPTVSVLKGNIPSDIYSWEENKGIHFEVLIPLSSIKNQITGRMVDGKLEGYEIEVISPIPPSYILSYSSYFEIYNTKRIKRIKIKEFLEGSILKGHLFDFDWSNVESI